MTRRVLRVLVEVEGASFDPDDSNPYADSQAELEAVLTSNLQTITSMDAGDVITLRDTNGNRCGKVEMEDFPGDDPLLPYWTRLSDYALEVEEEFPVAKFLETAKPDAPKRTQKHEPLEVTEVEGTETRPERFDEHATRAFDEGKFADPFPGRLGSHEHIAQPDPDDPVYESQPRTSRKKSDVPPPPGDKGMRP